MPRALVHFVQRAASLHLPRFDAWFPAVFDWEALCEDAPEMARRAGRSAAADARLRELAGGVFRAAHVVSLAVLCAGAESEEDPEVLLDRLTSAPDEEEEEVFRALAERALGSVESVLGGVGGAGRDHDVRRAAALVTAVWPAVLHVLAEDEEDVFDEAGGAAGVLGGVARIAAILAAFRWMAVERTQGDWPEPPRAEA